jgi:hypothetical protein
MKKQQLIIGHSPTVDGKSAERVANISSVVTRSMRSCHLLARAIINVAHFVRGLHLDCGGLDESPAK